MCVSYMFVHVMCMCMSCMCGSQKTNVWSQLSISGNPTLIIRIMQLVFLLLNHLTSFDSSFLMASREIFSCSYIHFCQNENSPSPKECWSILQYNEHSTFCLTLLTTLVTLYSDICIQHLGMWNQKGKILMLYICHFHGCFQNFYHCLLFSNEKFERLNIPYQGGLNTHLWSLIICNITYLVFYWCCCCCLVVLLSLNSLYPRMVNPCSLVMRCSPASWEHGHHLPFPLPSPRVITQHTVPAKTAHCWVWNSTPACILTEPGRKYG